MESVTNLFTKAASWSCKQTLQSEIKYLVATFVFKTYFNYQIVDRETDIAKGLYAMTSLCHPSAIDFKTQRFTENSKLDRA
jgi:hypothetical protein